jgi:serine/threonine protein kinase
MSVPSPKESAIAPGEHPGIDRKSGESDPLIGRVISDRFRILAPIARGGMGVVYKAEQAPLGRLVAIKILSLKHDSEKDPEFRRRFFLEAATVAKLTHPNTVTVFDYGQGDMGLLEGSQGEEHPIYYIAMELVNGRTLKKALGQEGPFPPARAINIVKQICRSLREAHRLGVIHRDMKPGNVMLVDRDGEDYVKVLDFGLVKEINPENPEEDLTQAGVFMGSPKYMAPEQIQGEHVDGRCDIYAIGVMMYEMLTGRVPFNRENPMQVLMDHVREPPPPMVVPSGVAPIPPELQAVVYRCLEKKRDARYPDMEAMLVALKAGAGGVEGAAISSTSREVDLTMSTGGTPVSGVHTVGPTSPVSGMPSGSGTLTGGVVSLAPAPQPRSRAPMFGGLVAALSLIAGGLVFASSQGLLPAWASIDGDGTPPGIAGEGSTIGEPGTDVAGTGEEPTTVGAPPGDHATAAGGSAVVATGTSTVTHPAVPEETIRTLLLDIRSTPPGATVRIGERDYGPTPTQVELVGPLAVEGTELLLVFERGGYRNMPVTRRVEGSTMQVEARLLPVRRASSSSSSSSSESGGVDTRVEGYRDSPY